MDQRSSAIQIVRPEPKIKVPAGTQPVFKGVIYDVYQWQQEQFDGSYRTFEALKRPDTVSIIPTTVTGKIILLEQQQPGLETFIGCPGGRVDPGEDVLTAAARELHEETGYMSPDWDLLCASQITEKIDWVIFHLIARKCVLNGDSEPEAGEKISLMTVSFDEFIDLAQQPNFRDHEMLNIVLKAKLHPEGMQQLKDLLFRE